jgi:hypothetical protein
MQPIVQQQLRRCACSHDRSSWELVCSSELNPLRNAMEKGS